MEAMNYEFYEMVKMLGHLPSCLEGSVAPPNHPQERVVTGCLPILIPALKPEPVLKIHQFDSVDDVLISFINGCLSRFSPQRS